ncbi:MAG: glycosyltransferase family 4 protein [Microthrixaceae bacterium]
MRVVHVVTRSHRRGAEVVASELAAALDDRGHLDEVWAIARAADGKTTPGLPPLVSSTRLGLATYLRATWRLRRLMLRHPPDVLLAHGGSAAIVIAFGTWGINGLRVWQRILGLPVGDWGPIRRTFWRGVGRRFDGVVALTASMEAEMRALRYRGPVWTIPNARDPRRFEALDRAATAAALRAEIGSAPDVGVLGFVGHLVEQKQPELLVDVLDGVRRAGRPVHLVIAGDGARRGAVEQRVTELGLGRFVTLLGHRDDPELVYGGSDLVLITSADEGMPGVAIEAQMAGCPVVSFPVGGADEVVEEGVTGVILERPDVAAMVDRVVELLGDPARLQAMGVAARARSERFTIASAAAVYEERFASALGDRASGR